jgi:putative peptidoglycan lipid II flippase
VLRAAAIVFGAFILSRLLGLVRDIVITNAFGINTLEGDAYAIATRLPDTIFHVIAGGALGSAFIPTFSAHFARDDAAGGWRLFSSVISLVTIVTIVVASITAIWAGPLIRAFFPDLLLRRPELIDVAPPLLRVMLLSTVIFGISGVMMGALNARQHFLLPAIAPVIYNLGIIFGVLFWAPNIMGFAYGTVLGAFGHAAIQLPGLLREKARYRFRLTVRDPSVRRVLGLMGPRVLGLSFSYINPVLTQLLAQSMVLGSLRALDLGWRLMVMPQAILGQALGIAAFPTFATLAATGALAEMRRILADSLRLVLFLGLPAIVGLILLREPLILVLFRLDSAEMALVAWALLFYAPGLVALAAIEVVARAFYALSDTRTPVLAGASQLLVMALLGWWLGYTLFPSLGWQDHGGLALAASLANYLELGLLLYWLRPKLGGIGGQRLLDGLGRVLGASMVMALAMVAARQALSSQGALVKLIALAAVGGIAYLLAGLILRVEELRQLTGLARRRLGW